jgi:ribose 5-phosphate isomerase B
MRNIVIASDHGGLLLKGAIVAHLGKAGLAVQDLGTHEAVSCDYPPLAHGVCARVLAEEGTVGILVCGTGLGMSMAANRLAGIRAAVCTNEFMARMSRAHNDANVLCLGERVVGVGLGLSVVDAFLATSFEGGRHLRRIELIEKP